MGADVAQGVFRAVVGQVCVAGVIKGELQHLHAGQAAVLQKLHHGGGHETQILGNEAHLGEPAHHRAQHVHAGALFPVAFLGALGGGGNGPVALKATEVVDADHVKELGSTADAADPPAPAVPAHGFPVVKGVAPELAVLGEVVGGNAGHHLGMAVPIQQEFLALAPDVGAVQRNVDGHVADDLDAQLVHIVLQCGPLGKEPVLHMGLEGDLVGKRLPCGLNGKPLVAAQGLVGPVEPGGAKVQVQCPEEGILLHPEILLGPGGHLPALGGAGAGKGLAQEVFPIPGQGAIVHSAAFGDFGVFQLFLRQPAGLGESGQVNEQGIACEGRLAGIGGVACAHGANRQDLPPALACSVQEIGKITGFLAQRADAVASGERKNRQQNAGRTIHMCPLFRGRKPLGFLFLF